MSWRRKKFLDKWEYKGHQREEKESVTRGRGHGERRNILRNGQRGQGKATTGKEPGKLTCLFEYRDFFVKMRAHICLWSATWQPRIRSESKWDDKGDETTVSLISRRERGRERTREGERLPPSPCEQTARLGFHVKAGRAWRWSWCPLWPSAGQQCGDAKGREPGGDSWAPCPAGRSGFADTAQELMGENLLSSRDFLNWHFFTLKQARRKDEIVISKGFFFLFSYPSSPFLEHFYCWIVRKTAWYVKLTIFCSWVCLWISSLFVTRAL